MHCPLAITTNVSTVAQNFDPGHEKIFLPTATGQKIMLTVPAIMRKVTIPSFVKKKGHDPKRAVKYL